MVQKIGIYLLQLLVITLLLSFEKTIGMPLLFSFFVLQTLLKTDGYTRIAVLIAMSFMLSAAVAASMTICMILFLLALAVVSKFKEKTIISIVACVSLITTAIIVLARLQLSPLSFVYFGSIWLVVIAQSVRTRKVFNR